MVPHIVAGDAGNQAVKVQNRHYTDISVGIATEGSLENSA